MLFIITQENSQLAVGIFPSKLFFCLNIQKISLVKYLDEYEIGRFFSVLKRNGNAKDHFFFTLMYFYGCRVSEIISTKLDDNKTKSPNVPNLK